MNSIKKYILYLTVSLLIWGCARFGQETRPLYSPPLIKKELKEAFNEYAARVPALEASGSVRLFINNKKQPRIKCRLWAKLDKKKILFRLTGFGPFGIRIFDSLYDGNLFYLYLAGHRQVYVLGSGEELIPGKKLAVFAQEAALVFNPWQIISQPQHFVEDCGDNEQDDQCARIKISYFSRDTFGNAEFDKETLSPLAMHLSQFKVEYSNIIGLRDGTPYPAKFTIAAYEFPLSLLLEIKKLKTGEKTAADPALFEPDPFLKHHLQPLKMVLNLH